MHSSSWKIWAPEVLIVWVAFWAVVLGGLALRVHLSDPTVAPRRWSELRATAGTVIGIAVLMALAVIGHG